jgi:hypothetical protein
MGAGAAFQPGSVRSLCNLPSHLCPSDLLGLGPKAAAVQVVLRPSIAGWHEVTLHRHSARGRMTL